MDVKIKYNDFEENCWCIYCKTRIQLGEKYISVSEEDNDGKFEKNYHLECCPETPEEDDEIYYTK